MFRVLRQLKRASSLLLIAMLVLVAGCQTVAAPQAPVRVKQMPDDPCATQLHDLCGYLLQYYLVEKRLPTNLDDLKPLVDADQPLTLACPVSGQAYTYSARGLIAPGDRRELIVFDASPSHDGKRQAILAAPPDPDTARPLSLWVVQIPEQAFKLYHPRGQ